MFDMYGILANTIHTLVNFKKGKIERVDTLSIILTKIKTFTYVGYSCSDYD
jgi:hypothetical protein